MASKQAMYRHEAKKALILQKRRVRANQERLGLRATDPDPIREKELDHMKLLLLENHLLLLENDTKEEDEKILAWVKEHGPKDWTKLARSLGRKYAGAGPSVQQRYEELEGRLKGNRKGTYVFEENSCIFKEVLKQVPEAFEKRIEESKINFKAIASRIGRSNRGLYYFYASTVHPTVMRYKAGTLEKDVRGDLIQEVKKKKNWIYSVDIEFDKVAAMPKFEGHNRTSLYKLYKTMMKCVTLRTGQKSVKEVTVEQMENYWRTSKRIGKKKKLLEKEKEIVEAYLEIKRELLGD